MKKLILILLLFTACKSSAPYKTRFYHTTLWGQWYGLRYPLTDTLMWSELKDTILLPKSGSEIYQ